MKGLKCFLAGLIVILVGCPPPTGPDQEGIKPPTVPAGLTVINQTSSTLELSWNASVDATRYILHRDTNISGAFNAEVYDGTSTSFLDTNLYSDTDYYYKIEALNAGGSSGLSFAVGKTTSRIFWAIDSSKDYTTNPAGWYQLEADLVESGTNCVVYLERWQTVLDSTISSLVTEFDNVISYLVESNFSTPTDIDSNHKVILLLLDIQDNYNPPSVKVYTGGYFFTPDLYTNTELQGLGYPGYYKSNEAELLYIDVNPNTPTSEECKTIITHEYQHLVTTCQNVFREGGSNLPVWIHEGFSTSAEAIYQGVDIVSEWEEWYDADPLLTGNFGITPDIEKSISYGYPLVLWNIYPSNPYAVINNYALSHLFFSWLRIHMGSNSFFKTINDQVDNTVQSVISVCSATMGTDVNSFEKMLGRWWMANTLGGNGKTSGLESYKGLNNHLGPYVFGGAGLGVSIYASGAVHFVNSSYNNWTPSGGDSQIGYELGDVVAGTADYVAPFGTGASYEVMIVYNTESSGFAPRTSAVLPSVTLSRQVFDAVTSDSLLKVNGQTFKAKSYTNRKFRVGLEPSDVSLPELNVRK